MPSIHPLADRYMAAAAELVQVGRAVTEAGCWGGPLDSDRDVLGYILVLHCFFAAEDSNFELGEFELFSEIFANHATFSEIRSSRCKPKSMSILIFLPPFRTS